MAEVYPAEIVHDRVAHLPEVIAHVRTVAERHASRARANLAAHVHDGHSRIEVSHDGITDTIVWLSDNRGQRAALSIEFGRPRKGDMAPLGILSHAFDLDPHVLMAGGA